MSALAPLHIAGERFMLDPGGALLWPARKLMAVADLHLEKGSSFATRGQFVPPYDSAETLDRLRRLLRRHRPQRLVFLGDSFHRATSRLTVADAQALAVLAQGLSITWLLGNHDPALPPDLPGDAVDVLEEGPMTFRHIPTARLMQGHEVAGHLHPKAAMATRAGSVTRPCFVTSANRVLLPAFGAYTGGLEIADPAIATLFPRGGRAFLLGAERLFSFPVPPRRSMQPRGLQETLPIG
ncbi:ligase-associated DNA damage response endonuclease PdeM [Plastoroseomonas arctica]|uniref:Ligase-associated DNA damage response endonuclease PdeM n=1 Tax=Plastoroseomonas arctica TaxID=1509237 RepID=A0AAF1JXF1_9PROT|nr:ligase-associated DNA damage response endonuclease PdeM [Plastoroseomonas arctica]MBR0656116.1 ligase-associated DNA damage response endonuclease PdeM [Plastoroseomonas arctica]